MTVDDDSLQRYRAAEQQQQKVFIPMHRTASNSIDNKSNDKLPSSSSPNNNRPNGTVNNGGGAVWDWRPNHPAMNGQPSATIAGKSVEQLKTGGYFYEI